MGERASFYWVPAAETSRTFVARQLLNWTRGCKVMGDRDQTETLKLLIEAQNAFDELLAEGRIKRQVKVYAVKKMPEPNYYGLKLFAVKKFVRVFWMRESSSKSFKTAVRETILQHVN
jgi:hypothetical protein